MNIAVIIKQDNVDQEDIKLINRIMSSVDLPSYVLVNIKYYRIESRFTFFICLGPDASRAAAMAGGKQDKIVKIPPLQQLHNKIGNEVYRATAYHLLKDLHKFIGLKDKISSDKLSDIQLPDLNEKQLLKIKDDLLSEGVLGFSAINQEGKTVRIRVDESDNTVADINIHISELIALKMIGDVFKIKEPIIIHRSNKGESNE